jgi:hypothetical protein
MGAKKVAYSMNSESNMVLAEKNELYDFASQAYKIALKVLEEGLVINSSGKPDYDELRGRSWLAKLARDLKGDVSRVTIDKLLDSLLDRRILRHSATIMEFVEDDDGEKWARTYYVANEAKDDLLWLYRATHRDVANGQASARTTHV